MSEFYLVLWVLIVSDLSSLFVSGAMRLFGGSDKAIISSPFRPLEIIV
jgi:hypothetical protein